MRFTTANRILFGLGVATLVAALPHSWAAAATATTTFAVSATVTANCTVSASGLNFGTYSGAVTNGTTTITTTCSNGSAYTIGLDAGTATGATVTTRKMKGPGTNLLGYGLFRDAARSLNWGNTAGTDTVASTGTGAAQSFTVFGQIPASEFAGVGAYTDTITVTLTF